MSFANLLPRAPWTPPRSQPAQYSQPAQHSPATQPTSRNDQPARPYSKRQAAGTSQAQPVTAEQAAPLPEQGQGTMALVQRRNSSAVYSLLPLPRYEQHSAQRPPAAKRGRPLRPADALARQLEGRCAGVAIAYLEIMSARRSRQQLAQWVSADCFHRLLPFFPKNPRQVRKEMLLTLPPVLLRVRAQKVHEELYEVVALLRCADKVRVVTMQMRLIYGTWLITSIEQPQSRTDEE
ncbi:Rv3235 family protein [uncultured Rothia sp.]|uniref:Rv3235 family protein n=1 Tax=uncultured Rothia sp. TaxID=316088 RepID=UPI0026193822|nr:Rv3235 family protein [uncultured Rothia sp.]